MRKPLLLKIVGDYAWEQGVQRFGVDDLLDTFLSKQYGIRVAFLKKIETMVASRSHLIITPSKYLGRVIRSWGIGEEKIHVIPNAIDKDASGASPDLSPLPSGWRMVSCGRLVPWKGFATLIALLPELADEIPDIHLIIIGTGPDEKVLKDLAKKHGVSSRVLFMGNQPRKIVHSYFAAGNLFILNTGYEGFSHTLLEAMEAGVPIITTSSGGNPELIKHNENGILVEFDDKEALKREILNIYNDSDHARMLADTAKHMVAHFSKKTMLERTASLIHVICAS